MTPPGQEGSADDPGAPDDGVRAAPPRAGEVVCLTLVDAGLDGRCLGRHSSGMAVWVAGRGVPGDAVRVRVDRIRRRMAEGTLVEVLGSAPESIDPRCPAFSDCGGCTWQRLSPSDQAALKTRQVEQALRRLGGFPEGGVEPMTPSPAPWGGRNRIDLAFAGPAVGSEAPFRLGLHSWRPGHAVVEDPGCGLVEPLVRRGVEAVRGLLAGRGLRAAAEGEGNAGRLVSLVVRCNGTGEQVLIHLVLSGRSMPQWGEAVGRALAEELGDAFRGLVVSVGGRPGQPPTGVPTGVWGAGTLEERVAGRLLRLPAEAFWQGHAREAETLLDDAVEAAGTSVERGALDLYCGAGAIAFRLADRAPWVMGCDAAGASIHAATEAARRAGDRHVRFVAGDVARLGTPSVPLPPHARAPGALFVDPPRAGLSKEARRRLGGLSAERLVYISCNPASLARDAAWLREEAGWQLARVRPYDLFPQTRHVEVLAVLERGTGGPAPSGP